MNESLLNAALHYAELGYRVFPCVAGEKRPRTANGFRDATTDPAQIKAWWTRWPEANVAIATEGLLVIDVDPEAGDWPHDLDKAYSLLQAGAIAITPRGGRHYYFRQPAGANWRCSAGRLAKGVDVRANGGYALVWPSRTMDGYYQWLVGYELDRALPEPPSWLIGELADIIKQSPIETSERTAIENSAIIIPEGRRNDALTRLAGSMRRVGMTYAEILAALQRINLDRCRPPLLQAEIEAVAKSICRYSPDQIATILAHGLEADLAADEQLQFIGITSKELAEAKYNLHYLVENTLVQAQPMIIAGPKKTLKTSISIDLALSLAEGGLFLGRLNVPSTVRVGIMSGESGAPVIQETALRIAACKGRELAAYENAIWCFDLPRLGRPQHMDALKTFIGKYQLEVLILDPTYLMMPDLGDDASNLFVVGRYLKELATLAEENGITPILCHHLRKLRANPYDPPELDEIAWAGFQEFARQWILISRRKRYDPADGGHHELWLNVGGSAGHSSLWSLDIDEGIRGNEDGRRWEVALTAASTVFENKKHEKEEAKRDAILQALEENSEGVTARTIRRIGREQTDAIIDELLAANIIEPCMVRQNNGQKYEGWRLTKNDDLPF